MRGSVHHSFAYVCGFLAALAYIGAAAALRTGNNPESKLIMLALEYLVLLPGLFLVLAKARGMREKAEHTPDRIPAWAALAAYLIACVPLAAAVRNGIYNADESAYVFESKIMLTGSVTTPAPRTSADSSTSVSDIFFENHVVYRDRWFGKYPPGWPALLAPWLWAKAGWVLNPLLGGILLWLTWAVAKKLYGRRVARIAAVIMALSPFFVLNCAGYMSHPACGAALAGATLLLLRGLDSGRLREFVGMFALLAIAFLVRPATTAAASLVLVAVLVWNLRAKAGPVLLTGAAFASAAIALFVAHNRALTGSYFLSPYAVSRNTEYPVEINFHLANLWHNVMYLTSVSVAKTVLDALPFVFLLAGYALVRERWRLWPFALAALFLSIVGVYLAQVEVSDSVVGERYYFEGYFAIAILAARGWTLLTDAWRLPSYAVRAVVGGLIAVHIFHFALLTATILTIKTGYVRVLDSVAQLHLRRAVVLMKSAPGFRAKNFNPNDADWENADVFYIKDPGAARRDEVACALGRPEWVLVSYDIHSRRALVEARGRAACGLRDGQKLLHGD